jgi:DNA-binding protein Fis
VCSDIFRDAIETKPFYEKFKTVLQDYFQKKEGKDNNDERKNEKEE